VRARLARINFDVRSRDFKAALTTAQAALGAIPADPQLLGALATVQLLNRDPNQALETLKQLVAIQPQNPLPLLRLAEVQQAIKDYSGALASERKALSLKPDLGQAWAAIAKTYLVSGRPDEALAEARKLQKELPDKAAGFALEGEILAAQKKWNDAIVAYRKAIDKQPVPVLAVRIFTMLQAAGKADEAQAMATDWIKRHPKDPTLVQLVAERDQARKDYAKAIEGYKRVLEIDDDNVPALNNLAWILTEQKDPKGLEYAREAHRLAPMNPSVLDTLGWSVTRSGDAKRGVQLLRMASALAPNQTEIRLHLAKALIDAGEKSAAKQTLTELTSAEKDSPVKAEAQKLLQTL
jgi:putative PEP-CTERM system TPR-repeat lipoprotein